jgi:hypothetical protein
MMVHTFPQCAQYHVHCPPLMRIMPLVGVDTAVPAALTGVLALGGHGGTPRDGGTRGR